MAVSTASEGGSSASTVARDTGADQARGAVSGGFRAPRGHYLPIAEHGLIGDLHTVALVGTDGTIDWYCCPRFDSPSPEPMPTRAITSARVPQLTDRLDTERAVELQKRAIVDGQACVQGLAFQQVGGV